MNEALAYFTDFANAMFQAVEAIVNAFEDFVNAVDSLINPLHDEIEIVIKPKIKHCTVYRLREINTNPYVSVKRIYHCRNNC